jgi:hypothetical protein
MELRSKMECSWNILVGWNTSTTAISTSGASGCKASFKANE